MDGGYQVVSVSDVRQPHGVLKPGFLDVRIENSFSVSVEDSGGDNIGTHVLFFEIKHLVFELLDLLVFFDWVSKFVIIVRKRQVSILFALLGFCRQFLEFTDFALSSFFRRVFKILFFRSFAGRLLLLVFGLFFGVFSLSGFCFLSLSGFLGLKLVMRFDFLHLVGGSLPSHDA